MAGGKLQHEDIQKMREMLKEFEEKPNETEEADSEDRLTMALMSRKERRAKKRSIMKARMADMTRNEKIKYIVYYYKWHFFFTVAAILIFSALAITIYKNSRPVSLSAAVLNPEDSIALSDKPFKEFVKDAKLDKGHRLLADAYYNVTLEYELAKNSDISSVTSLSMLVKDDYYDVIITNLAGLEYCMTISIRRFLIPIKIRYIILLILETLKMPRPLSMPRQQRF